MIRHPAAGTRKTSWRRYRVRGGLRSFTPSSEECSATELGDGEPEALTPCFLVRWSERMKKRRCVSAEIVPQWHTPREWFKLADNCCFCFGKYLEMRCVEPAAGRTVLMSSIAANTSSFRMCAVSNTLSSSTASQYGQPPMLAKRRGSKCPHTYRVLEKLAQRLWRMVTSLGKWFSA
jgi:hypothetical protein